MSNSSPSILFLHAHPDDECILTGATLAKAANRGLRTIVAYGTRGDAGQTNADLGGESLGDRRVREATNACAELGVARIEWLPYADSGMVDTAHNHNPAAFSNITPNLVAADLVTLLADENIEAVVGYDPNGTYGHPDHKQVHHVAQVAAGQLGANWVLDATYNREILAALPEADGLLDPNFAAADADLSHFVSGDEWFAAKFRALAHHGSQVPDDWDTENPDLEGFRARFGTEWFTTRSLNGSTELGILSSVLEPKPTRR